MDQKAERAEDSELKDYTNETNLYWLLKTIIHDVAFLQRASASELLFFSFQIKFIVWPDKKKK